MACDILLHSSHISPISLLPGSADIIERTIRAAVEQHFYDLKSSIHQEISSYESPGAGPSERSGGAPSAGSRGEEGGLCETQEGPASSPPPARSPPPETHQDSEHSPDTQQEAQDSDSQGTAMEEGSGMDLDAEALVDAENNINTARQEHTACEKMDQADLITCAPGACVCDLNANPESSGYPCQPARGQSHPAHRLHLCHVFPDPDSHWEDPVPAYKSWQDESEGEAQLSPLAGRMVAPPLEDDAHPLMARRFLDFGHRQRFLQQDPDAASPTKALPCGRQRRASFGSKEGVRSDSVSHQLTKKLQNLKKKMKQFEEQFERENHYQPSHGDKAANPKVLKWMTDITKIRKQIKGRHHLFPKGSLRHQAVLQSYRRHPSSSSSAPNTPHYTLARPLTACKQASQLYAKHKESELTPMLRPRSNTLPKSFGSTLEQGPGEGGDARGHRPTREETLEHIQRRVRGKREEDGWPEDIKKMTKEQLSCEKTVLQKNLLHYEGLHGRPATREERHVVKPLYDRYRLVKQTLTRISITPIIVSPSSKRRNQILQPIIEGETAHFCEEIKEEEEEEEEEEVVEEGSSSSGGRGGGGETGEEEVSGEEVQSSGSEVIMALDPGRGGGGGGGGGGGDLRSKMEESSGKLALDLRLSSSNASSMPELLEQLWKARAEKKRLRKTIRGFEDLFYQQNGRTVLKEDRLPMMEEYKEYKRIKAKLRLLEVLISKQDSSKSI